MAAEPKGSGAWSACEWSSRFVFRETAAFEPGFEHSDKRLNLFPVQVHAGLIRGVKHAIMWRCLPIHAEPDRRCAWFVGVFVVKDTALLKRARGLVAILKQDQFKTALGLRYLP